MHIRTLGCIVLLLLLLFTAFLIRIQGTPTIPEGEFTGVDPYLYYRQAQLISEHGKLPPRDMDRWLPLGRDLGQTLNLYSYALAYTHKAVANRSGYGFSEHLAAFVLIPLVVLLLIRSIRYLLISKIEVLRYRGT